MTGSGRVYGEALYELAKSENLAEGIWGEISVLNESFCRVPDFLRLLSASNLGKQERCAVLDTSFRGKVHPYVLNFLKILTEKGHIRYFSDCCTVYRQRQNADNGILPVTAVTAVPLSEKQAEKLTKRLAALTGKTIDLENRVDPDVLGGIRLDYGGRRLEDTVLCRLQAVREKLKAPHLDS